MDLGLEGRVVWLLGAGASAVWQLAEVFLEEGAVVRIVTTKGGGPTAGRLKLRFGRNLRAVFVGEHASLLTPSLLPHLLDVDQPHVIVLCQMAVAMSQPSAHEWDEFVRLRGAELRSGGTVVVVEPHPAFEGEIEATETLAEWALMRQRAWYGFAPPSCAMSFIALSPTLWPAADRQGSELRRASAQGISALTVFMASRGRGRTAVVGEDGLPHLL